MDETKLPLIGLTGGIASGKSTVSQYLRQKGFHVIDADQLGHRVLAPEQPSYHQVLEAFGHDILNQDGAINRRSLGNIVFNDPAALEKLNQISHPRIREMILHDVEKFASHSRAGLVFLEAAILLEGRNFPACQQIWIVAVDPEIAIARLQERNQFTREAAKARLNAQLSNEERRNYADVWIENDGSLEMLFQQVDTTLTQMGL